MKNRIRKITGIVIVVYFLLYLSSIYMQNEVLMIIVKPLATFLAYFSLKKFGFISEKQQKTKSLVCNAILLWFIVDIVAAVGELSSIYLHSDISDIYNIEIILYAVVRVMILISVVELYYFLTKNANRFQIIADIITIFSCIFIMSWLIFFNGEVDEFKGENFEHLMKGNLLTLFSLFYILVSLGILGVYLIAWFHFQNLGMTMGQRLVMLGIAGVAATDLIISLNNSLMDKPLIDIAYKAFIMLFALGSVFSEDRKSELNKAIKTEVTGIGGNWKNAVYILVYPVTITFIIGPNIAIIIFSIIIAFYISSCLYVKQIAVTNELLKSEKSANERLKLYSKVLEQAPLSVVITDMNGDIQYCNPYFTQVSGYSLEEAIGKNPRILKSGKTPQEDYTALWEKLTQNQTWEGAFVNIDKEGNEYEEKAIITPIKDTYDNTTHYVAIKENITETKKIKNQLSNQNYFTTQILNTVPSAIFYLTEDDVFLGVNSEFERIYQTKNAVMVGRNMRDIPWMKEHRYQKYLHLKNEAIRTNAPYIEEIERQTPAGVETTVLYSVSAFYLADGTRGGFLGVMTDVTELKQKERDLKIALKQSNAATEAKSHFLANMSHEIRTPMNAIIGMSYLALKTELDKRQRDYVNKIHFAATSLLQIVNDILDFSKIESGKLELDLLEFNLDTVITESINLLLQKAQEKQLELIYHSPLNVPNRVTGDPLRLGQIITNLVSNAVKFTENGTISIDIFEMKRVEKRICLKFSIKDTGIGIDDENKDRLFEAFTQSDSSTTRKFGGTGLGLTICRSLVEMMDGHIWVDSEIGKGSNFSFTAWFTFDEEDGLEQMRLAKDIYNLYVLIISDNSESSETLVEYLNELGFRSDVVSSADEASRMLTGVDIKDPYNMVIVDWKTQESESIQIMKEISELNLLENAPVRVLITDEGRTDIKKQLSGVHVDGYLYRPINQSALYDTIVNLFTRNNWDAMENEFIEEEDFHLGGMRILLAEDNDVNQQIAVELLKGQGIEVDIANNGLEAVKKMSVATDTPKYDLILMDLQMPEMDGFEAVRQIRKNWEMIPIIAMTARTMVEEKEKCFQVGMNDHIAKPIIPYVLFTTIKKWTDPELLRKLKSVKTGEHVKPFIAESELLIQGINTKEALTRVSGNIVLYKKLLHNFAENQPATIKLIRQDLGKGNFENVEKLSHMLRGVSGNIGAVTIQYICSRMEKAAEGTKNVLELNSLIDQLDKEMNMTVNSIFSNIEQEDEENETNQEIEGDVNMILKKLMALLEDGDSEAVEYFHLIKKVLTSGIDKEKIHIIENLISNYEYDEAGKILEGLNV